MTRLLLSHDHPSKENMNTTMRTGLLAEALSWLSEHYRPAEQPITEPVAWEQATRAVLNIPLSDDVPLVQEDFPLEDFRRAQRAFVEIVEVARRVGDEHTTDDETVCVAAYESIKMTGQQPDLSIEQRKSAALEGMVDALQFYLTYLPGGLQDATRDLGVTVTDQTFAALLDGPF